MVRLNLFTAGLHGSGKSVLAESAEELGFQVISMGDAVREEVKRRGNVPTNDVISEVSTRLRQESGPAAVAKITLEVFKINGEKVLFDGLRSLEEKEFFSLRLGGGDLISVHASPKIRYERWMKRRRIDDPPDFESFLKRDFNDLSFGLGNLMVMAEHHLVNQGFVRAAFKAQCTDLVRRILLAAP